MTEVVIIGGDKDHAEFSASGSHRWLSCPGSHELSKQAPVQAESRYAAEGTQAHACLEFLLKNRTRLDAAVISAGKRYTADMVKYAKEAVDWILGQEAGEILSETRVDSSLFTCNGQFGTLDAAIVREFGRLTVIDYKYGAGIPVDPALEDGTANSQLVYYALGLFIMYEGHNFTDVELVVIQPRAWHPSGETTRTHIMSVPELLSWKDTFRNGVMATSDPNAPLAAGSWCKFCTAATICPELKDESLRAAQIEFDDDTGLMVIPEALPVKIPNLGKVLTACDKLEAWIAVVRQHAQGLLERGEEVPGWKLVQKRATRKWKNDAAVITRFGEKAYAPRKVLSPAQLEKTIKSAAEWTKANTTAESSGLTLVDSSDKRPAVNPAHHDFLPENDPAFS